tara:strand:+ start:79 stop:282 length:204 start_codon:yes stop_codon:yes gene_type:complete
MTWDYYDIEKDMIRRDSADSEVSYSSYVKMLNETMDKIRMLPVPKTKEELFRRMRLIDKFLEEARRN